MVLLLLLLLTGAAAATTLRVPSDYATIQVAFNAVQTDDTVLVALGTYAEALSGPPVACVLKGDVTPDTGDYPRPEVDPSTLPNPNTLRCLIVNASGMIIEDFRFRNGAQMYPHPGGWGGVYGAGGEMLFRRCVFDSTAGGYWAPTGQTCVMEDCRFVNNQKGCVGAELGHMTLVARDCFFQGRANPVLWLGAGTQLLRCHFLGNDNGPICHIAGRNILVQDCIFGPSMDDHAASWNPALFLVAPEGIIENNIITGMHFGDHGILVYCACNDTDEVLIRHNRIIGNTVTSYGGSTGIEISNCVGTGRCLAEVDSNVFEDNGGNVGVYRGIHMCVEVHAVGNRFHRLTTRRATPTGAVRLTGVPGSDFHANRFDSTGLAALVEMSAFTYDAHWNWWGDSTGPYNAGTNPLGIGDTVSAQVDYSPWCADTVCPPSESAVYRAPLKPERFTLTAYPNPFNSTTVIRLEVPQAAIVRMELFDLLGRRVIELWSGAVADEQEIAVNGSALASGVYFVRATNTIWNRPLATTKLVLMK